MTSDLEEQEDELLALQSIFSSEEFGRNGSNRGGEIRVCVELPAGFTVAMKEGEATSRYEVSSLPPLLLTFDLPEDYPSSSPPSFTLACVWLTHAQLAALRAQLIRIYQASGGAAVLFTWAQFLREDALGLLDVHDLLQLPSDRGRGHDGCHAANGQPDNAPPPEPGAAPNPSRDPSARCEGGASAPVPSPSQRLLSRILIHDAAQRQRRFASTVFECGVCFAGRLGSGCVKLPECGHVFCRECLAEFCKVQIAEGNVRGVACPQGDCPSAPTPAQVHALVGEDLFGRYDRLLLQNTLERMPDVVYCPRRDCGTAVIRDKSGNAAMCSVCGFAFCVACRKTYHGAGGCRDERAFDSEGEDGSEEGKLPLPTSTEGLVALWEDYDSGGRERKRLLESRYGRSVMAVKLNTFLSEGWVAVNTKYCPHCFSRIEKFGGCNLMTCCRCLGYFCWICLTKLTLKTLAHFDSGTCSRYW